MATKKEHLWITTKVLEIVEKIVFDKTKTVFKCESSKGEPRLCIYWSDVDLHVGDTVEMKGFFADTGNAFIVKKLFIKTA